MKRLRTNKKSKTLKKAYYEASIKRYRELSELYNKLTDHEKDCVYHLILYLNTSKINGHYHSIPKDMLIAVVIELKTTYVFVGLCNALIKQREWFLKRDEKMPDYAKSMYSDNLYSK